MRYLRLSKEKMREYLRMKEENSDVPEDHRDVIWGQQLFAGNPDQASKSLLTLLSQVSVFQQSNTGKHVYLKNYKRMYGKSNVSKFFLVPHTEHYSFL